MDTSAVKAIVDRHIEPLMESMGIPHWKISVYYDSCSDPEWVAECRRICDYNQAWITIDPRHAVDEAGVVKSLVHELCHVILAPLDVYREAMTQHIENGTDLAKQENRLWSHFIEQTVINCERMYRGLNGRAGKAPPKKAGKSRTGTKSPR